MAMRVKIDSYSQRQRFKALNVITYNFFRHHVSCADVPQISSLGTFIHALLSRAHISVR